MQSRGAFITFEGGEGSGKTTQIRMLADALEARGIEVVQTREPGGTEGAERIRELLVCGDADRWDAVCETALFLTARRQHVTQLIEPALLRGQVVLCDRFMDSTLVYQGIGKQLGLEYVQQLSAMIVGNIKPDITILLDIPVEIGLTRASERSGRETRFESHHVSFHEQIRHGFLSLAALDYKRFCVMDATQDRNILHHEILQKVLFQQETSAGVVTCH